MAGKEKIMSLIDFYITSLLAFAAFMLCGFNGSSQTQMCGIVLIQLLFQAAMWHK